MDLIVGQTKLLMVSYKNKSFHDICRLVRLLFDEILFDNNLRDLVIKQTKCLLSESNIVGRKYLFMKFYNFVF